MLTSQELETVFYALAGRLGQPVVNVRRTWQLDPFTYGLNFLPATLSATTTARFTVNADSAFAICETSAVVSDTSDALVANISGVGLVFAPLLVGFSDSGAGRDLQDTNIAFGNVFGTASHPHKWPIPKILDPNSTFEVAVENLVATSYRVRCAFIGFKIFGRIEDFLAVHGNRQTVSSR